MPKSFQAKLKRDLYRSPEFSVAIMEDPDTYETYKVVGPLVPDQEDIKYDIVAEELEDYKHGGKKYEITSCSISECRGRKDMVLLLASGMFPGIGKATAGRIYDRFGDDSLSVIENKPDELSKIKGITREKAEIISRSYREHTSEAELYKYLAPFGFSAKQIHRIMQKDYVLEAREYIMFHPYSTLDIRGVTFAMADRVATDNGIPKDSIERVEAAAGQIIKQEMSNGHAGIEYKPLATALIKLLNTEKINYNTVGEYIKKLIAKGGIGYRKTKDETGQTMLYFYLKGVLDAEKELAEAIYVNTKHKTGITREQADKYLQLEERKTGIKLDDCQKDAIVTALTNGFSVITGGPGTGKTTIIKIMAAIWSNRFSGEKGIELMSPTGRAARRITEQTGLYASTIHSALSLGLSDETGSRSEGMEERDIENSLVIVDECSMLDMFLAKDMMKHLINCTVVFVGDSDQLPSVGCGKVLSDILESGVVAKAELKYIHRQEDGSTICDNADRVRLGNTTLRAASDFSIIMLNDDMDARSDDTMERVESKMVDEYKKLGDIYGRDNVAILCPFNGHPAGQLSINRRLQEDINPFQRASREIKAPDGTIYRIGDPIMQLVNSEGISNGEIGKVIAIDRIDGRDVLSVKYYDKVLTYTKDMMDQITLAYAMTVHKSQGSEYEAIITCLTDYHGPMLKRNILYTAITRAKKKVVLIGNKGAIKEAIQNVQTETRNTMLKYDLRALAEKGTKKEPEASQAKPEYEQMALTGI